MGEPPANAGRSEGERYREMARELRDRARQFRSSEARQQLLDLAIRYELMAEHVDARPTTDRSHRQSQSDDPAATKPP